MERKFEEHLLSAYLDDEISPEDRILVEQKLQNDMEACALLEDLRRVRGLVSSLPSWNGPDLDIKSTLESISKDHLEADDDTRPDLNEQARQRVLLPGQLESPATGFFSYRTRLWTSLIGLAAGIAALILASPYIARLIPPDAMIAWDYSRSDQSLAPTGALSAVPGLAIPESEEPKPFEKKKSLDTLQEADFVKPQGSNEAVVLDTKSADPLGLALSQPGSEAGLGRSIPKLGELQPSPTLPAPTLPAPTLPAPTLPAPALPAPALPAPTLRAGGGLGDVGAGSARAASAGAASAGAGSAGALSMSNESGDRRLQPPVPADKSRPSDPGALRLENKDGNLKPGADKSPQESVDTKEKGVKNQYSAFLCAHSSSWSQEEVLRTMNDSLEGTDEINQAIWFSRLPSQNAVGVATFPSERPLETWLDSYKPLLNLKSVAIAPVLQAKASGDGLSPTPKSPTSNSPELRKPLLTTKATVVLFVNVSEARKILAEGKPGEILPQGLPPALWYHTQSILNAQTTGGSDLDKQRVILVLTQAQ